jgi:hypothetical protein
MNHGRPRRRLSVGLVSRTTKLAGADVVSVKWIEACWLADAGAGGKFPPTCARRFSALAARATGDAWKPFRDGDNVSVALPNAAANTDASHDQTGDYDDRTGGGPKCRAAHYAALDHPGALQGKEQARQGNHDANYY